MMIETSIPVSNLNEATHNLEILYEGTTGIKCPRCGGGSFGKLGYYKYKGKKHPRKLCNDCGYAFSIIDFKKEGATHNRAARILNLDNLKSEKIFEDTLAFGLIKKNTDGTYSTIKQDRQSKKKLYQNIPLYKYLIDKVGYNLKRNVFENALASCPDISSSKISKIKRDVLWKRYQEIAIEIFVCEKTCKFSGTCKKDHSEHKECSIVKKAKITKREWRVDIEL